MIAYGFDKEKTFNFELFLLMIVSSKFKIKDTVILLCYVWTIIYENCFSFL